MIRYLVYRMAIIGFGLYNCAVQVTEWPRNFRPFPMDQKSWSRPIEWKETKDDDWRFYMEGRYDKRGYLGHITLHVGQHEWRLR